MGLFFNCFLVSFTFTSSSSSSLMLTLRGRARGCGNGLRGSSVKSSSLVVSSSGLMVTDRTKPFLGETFSSFLLSALSSSAETKAGVSKTSSMDDVDVTESFCGEITDFSLDGLEVGVFDLDDWGEGICCLGE